jgi:tRNA A37 methylthiotransferase MiaB
MAKSTKTTDPTDKTIYFVSLGCPKNRVDSEVMLGVARREGYTIVDEPTRPTRSW